MKILDDRFWSKVNKTGACWLWTGATTNGYGSFWLDDRRRAYHAHRLSYSAHFGEIPDGLVIDHICHQPSCVNPNHLQAVTVRQNQENRSGPQKNSSSGHRGVARHRGKWKVVVRSHGKQVYGGTFTDPVEAASVAAALRAQLMSNSIGDAA